MSLMIRDVERRGLLAVARVKAKNVAAELRAVAETPEVENRYTYTAFLSNSAKAQMSVARHGAICGGALHRQLLLLLVAEALEDGSLPL